LLLRRFQAVQDLLERPTFVPFLSQRFARLFQIEKFLDLFVGLDFGV